MSRKLVLLPTKIEAAHSLAATFNSTPTVIDYMDNCAYQINVTTTNSTGTFSVQASLDYVPANGFQTAVAGNWIDLTLSGGPTVNAANDNIMIYLNELPFRAIRLHYTSTIAGTGVADIWIMNKAMGS